MAQVGRHCLQTTAVWARPMTKAGELPVSWCGFPSWQAECPYFGSTQRSSKQCGGAHPVGNCRLRCSTEPRACGCLPFLSVPQLSARPAPGEERQRCFQLAYLCAFAQAYRQGNLFRAAQAVGRYWEARLPTNPMGFDAASDVLKVRNW